VALKVIKNLPMQEAGWRNLMRVNSIPPELEPIGKNSDRPSQSSSDFDRSNVDRSNFDQTRFSLDPSQLQLLEAQILAQPEIRRSKVRLLRRAIGNGEYSVSADRVADALVSELDEAPE
jgi:flagellar biosynthesis anti-sigma factor FlgM